ncbi:MAG: type II toxin-antitoxin system VapC family toxin [Cyanobacteria bacterium P01_F01_bin.86]
MSGSYLLDTNIIIGLFAGQASIINQLRQSDEVFIPSIALGELHYGARKSGRVQQNLERIEEFVADVTVVDCDAATARQYGDVKNRLRQKGRPLPENDIWIAALALQYDLVLVTRDAHFQHIEGLQIVQW